MSVEPKVHFFLQIHAKVLEYLSMSCCQFRLNWSPNVVFCVQSGKIYTWQIWRMCRCSGCSREIKAKFIFYCLLQQHPLYRRLLLSQHSWSNRVSSLPWQVVLCMHCVQVALRTLQRFATRITLSSSEPKFKAGDPKMHLIQPPPQHKATQTHLNCHHFFFSFSTRCLLSSCM